MKKQLPPTVSFAYDEIQGKWDILVINVPSPLEAAQAFNAIVLTCKTVEKRALAFTAVSVIEEGVYHITPAHILPNPEMN